MANHTLWSDEYWLLLMQLYLRKPMGVKPVYSRDMVDLALELHIHPKVLYDKMFQLRRMELPFVEKLWEKYSRNPKKLARGVALLKKMKGFGQADDFYDGVETNESWEKDFKPLTLRTPVTSDTPHPTPITPVHLILILDEYFRLTPTTMAKETPEVKALGKLIKLSPKTIVEIMNVFMFCDPYLNRDDLIITPLLAPCQEIWDRYGNGNPNSLAQLAAQLKEWFK